MRRFFPGSAPAQTANSRHRPLTAARSWSTHAALAPQPQRRAAGMSSARPGATKRGGRSGGGASFAARSTADDDIEAASEDSPMLPPRVALEGNALLLNVLPAVLVAALGAFSFGYHLGIVNPALEHLARDLGIAGSVQLKGAVVSVCLIGATIGSLCSGRVADDLGRRAALVAMAGAYTRPLLSST